MALQQEVWIADIEENLFEGSEFILNSTNHDSFVVNSTVHVPQAGSAPAIDKNRTSLPATITQRTDTEVTYPVDSFTTDPILVQDFDELQTSYQKRQSVLADHVSVLNERMGTEVANIWALSANAKNVRTSGASTGSLPPGATGTRKRVVKEDIANLAKTLDKDLVPSTDRFLLMPTDLYYELFEIDALLRRDFMDRTALPQGVINTLFGFQIMIRPTVVIYDNVTDPVKKAVGAASAIDDNFGCIAWHRSAVAKALGGTKVFLQEDAPEYYGSIFSAEVALGARQMRSDAKGIVSLIQSA